MARPRCSGRVRPGPASPAASTAGLRIASFVEAELNLELVVVGIWVLSRADTDFVVQTMISSHSKVDLVSSNPS